MGRNQKRCFPNAVALVEFCPCCTQVLLFCMGLWWWTSPSGHTDCSSQSPRRCSHFPADLCLRPCPSQFLPSDFPARWFPVWWTEPVVQHLFAQCNSNSRSRESWDASSPETWHEAYLVQPECLATDSFICLETGQSILSVTFFFLNVNFMFTLVPASRHIRLFLVPSSARVTQARWHHPVWIHVETQWLMGKAQSKGSCPLPSY